MLQYKDICYGGAPTDYQDSEGLAQAFPTMSLQFAQVRAMAPFMSVWW